MVILDRFHELRVRFRDAVLSVPGATTAALRREIADGAGPGGALGALLEMVRRRAYAITDEEVGALRDAGESDDRLFETIAAAAVGEAERRLALGLAALEGGRR